MIKHIALWRLQAPSDGDTREAMFERIRTAVQEQAGRIPGLLEAEVGLNFKESPKALDVAVYTTFTDKAALEAYHRHPVHQETRAKVDALVASSVFMDYEV